MKIGTLTFHRAQNYGGVLQSYALVTFLRNNGYDAEIVDYHCPKIDEAYKLVNTKNIKAFVYSILQLPKSIMAKLNFFSFRKHYLTISEQQFYSASDFADQYDVCIMGSDQVWTLRLIGGFNPVFFGNFSPKICKIGYAVSVADISNFTENERKKMAEHLQYFSYFSTREDSLRDEMMRLTNRNVETVIDPSLLLTQYDYNQIIEEPNDTDYILYYQQEYNSQTKNVIVSVARQVGAKKIVVVTGKKEDYNFPYRYYSTNNLSVNKFLGLIKNAMVVFTTSFHGTAYSLVFRKDFYYIGTRTTDRARNLLSRCGALDRALSPGSNILFTKVDYSKVEPNLLSFIKKSEEFLLESLNETENSIRS